MATTTSPLGAAQDLPSLLLALRPLPDVAALRKIFGVAGSSGRQVIRSTGLAISERAQSKVVWELIPFEPGGFTATVKRDCAYLFE
jgi:hypothetical protein